MAYTQTPGRAKTEAFSNLPPSLNSGSTNNTSIDPPVKTTTGNKRLPSGQIVKETTTTKTTQGTEATPPTVIKGQPGTPGKAAILPNKSSYEGPLASNADWAKFKATEKGKAFTAKMELESKGSPAVAATPATPDIVIPGKPATPGGINTETKQENIYQPIYDVTATRGYIGPNAGKTTTKGTVTTNPKVAENYKKGTENYNAYISKKYGQYKEGEAGANGLTGKVLELRNKKAAVRLSQLTRTVDLSTTQGLLGLARKEAEKQKDEKQNKLKETNPKGVSQSF